MGEGAPFPLNTLKLSRYSVPRYSLPIQMVAKGLFTNRDVDKNQCVMTCEKQLKDIHFFFRIIKVFIDTNIIQKINVITKKMQSSKLQEKVQKKKKGVATDSKFFF